MRGEYRPEMEFSKSMETAKKLLAIATVSFVCAAPEMYSDIQKHEQEQTPFTWQRIPEKKEFDFSKTPYFKILKTVLTQDYDRTRVSSQELPRLIPYLKLFFTMIPEGIHGIQASIEPLPIFHPSLLDASYYFRMDLPRTYNPYMSRKKIEQSIAQGLEFAAQKAHIPCNKVIIGPKNPEIEFSGPIVFQQDITHVDKTHAFGQARLNLGRKKTKLIGDYIFNNSNTIYINTNAKGLQKGLRFSSKEDTVRWKKLSKRAKKKALNGLLSRSYYYMAMHEWVHLFSPFHKESTIMHPVLDATISVLAESPIKTLQEPVSIDFNMDSYSKDSEALFRAIALHSAVYNRLMTDSISEFTKTNQ